MAHMEAHEFTDLVVRDYQARRAVASQQHAARGRGNILGAPAAQKLFEAAVIHSIDEYGYTASPFPTARSEYTTRCLQLVWQSTRHLVVNRLLERLYKHRGLPKSLQKRRTLFREIVGKKAYYAILHTLGSYFELNLVVDQLVAMAQQRYAEQSFLRRSRAREQPSRRPKPSRHLVATATGQLFLDGFEPAQ